MNNKRGLVSFMLLIFVLAVAGGTVFYLISKKGDHPSNSINETGQENTRPEILSSNHQDEIKKPPTSATGASNVSSSLSSDIAVQLQINGSSENSVTLKTGQDAVITWSTENASQCFSEGKGSNAWSSQERTTAGRYVARNISLIGETQFTLACKSGDKTKSSTVTLNVVSSLLKLLQPSLPQPATPPTQIIPPSNNQPKQKILEKFASIVYDGTIYVNAVTIDSARVIGKFYETHPDAYDFIVIYSATPTNAQAGSGLTVKNGIRGNGSFFPNLDETAKYGSNGKLLGQIFIPPSLGLDAGGGIDLLGTLVHEVSHHWIMFIGDIADCKNNPNFSVKCAKAPTGFRVSQDGAHWSSNVDTFVREGGAVFKHPNGGLAWQMNAEGYCAGVVTTGNGVRFNDIDLYLMGFLPPNEAKPIYWYDLDGEFDEKLGGQKCIQHTLGVQDIVNTEGARQPAYLTAQRDFKIGFIILTAPGQSATQQQISRMNYIIDHFPSTWYEATRKTSTVSVPL